MSEQTVQSVRLTSLSPGAGCACKLPLASLEKLVDHFGPMLQPADPNLLIGLAEGDDAAALRIDDERALILTTDFFTPIVDDPYDWGRIAAANAMSDVYAMGGRPLVALNLTCWPGEELPIDMLAEVLRGATSVANSAGCMIVGGHTISDPVPKYGLAVVGIAHPDRLFAIDRAVPGQQLFLTKPIGTGVVATALKRGSPPPVSVRAAIESMTSLNAAASEVALAANVPAATDVTGFGLLGHLHRMLRASGCGAEVHADQVPLLPYAPQLVTEGFIPGGTRSNMSYLADAVDVDAGLSVEVRTLLHDAQTSGGLLLAAPDGADAGDLLGTLRRRGLDAAHIGTVTAAPAGRIEVRGAQS